jgi:two-component system cell cycle sensor histidine kinase/response regulator CckA
MFSHMGRPMATIRVLLVDDDEDDAVLTRAMVRDAHNPRFEVDWVATYDEALSRMIRREYQAYLVDYRLGEHSGLDLLLAAQAGGCTEPVILLTRQGTRTVDEEAMRSGAADFLIKDELTPPLLQRALRHAVERATASLVFRESEDRLIQAQRMESLGRLVGSVAHDFNNLLTGIVGYASILDRELSPQHNGRHSLEEIRKAAELATKLTRQLLAYSRKQIVKRVPLDLNELIDGLSEMLARLVGEHLTLTIEKNENLPPVFADYGQLEQVILNLVLNARDATTSGGTITVATAVVTVDEEEAARENVGRTGPFVRLTVADTGEGMSAEVLRHLFEPFFTTKPVGKGTGLGLASSHGIIRQGGGFMRVTSKPGEGTSASAYLPEAQQELQRQQPHSAVMPELRGKETILVIEDDETVRNFVREALTFYGYRALLAPDPTTALRIASESSELIAVALTDIVLPDMSGMHVAQQLVEVRPGLRIIYMSGYIDARSGHVALPPDAHFLRKPFQPEDLARLLRSVLDRATARTTRR